MIDKRKFECNHSFTVFPQDLNFSGSLFGGKVLAEMDIAAAKLTRRLLYKRDCDSYLTVSANRLPHYLLYDGYYELEREKIIEDSLAKRKFCNFVVSNGNCPERNNFFLKLNQYKKVDSGGRWMNTLGYAVDDKLKFQSEYKFSIAFENNAYRPDHPGYSTEKIMQPMIVKSIPIYWGNPVIDREFNTKSFINYYDFNDFDKVIDFVIELDKNDDKYLDMLRQPWFTNGIPEPNKEENIKSFLYKIFD